MEIFPGDFSFWRFVHGDFSLKIYSGDFSIEVLKIFKKIWSWRFFLWNMVLEIFPLKNGDFSFWRFVRGDFSLKIYSRDFSIEFLKIFKKICSWRFFLCNMVLEIFLSKNGDFSFWRFVHREFSLKIYSGDWTFEIF